MNKLRCAVFLCALFGGVDSAGAAEDIEFVAEHLAEVAMDNRFAALPLWSNGDGEASPWTYTAQLGYGDTRSGNLQVAGPMLSNGVRRSMSSKWSLGAFGFVDALALSGDGDFRPLQTLFSPGTPLARPVDARFDNLDGRLRHLGGGLQLAMLVDTDFLGLHRWTGGVLWQRVELRDYRLDYRLLAGPSTGAVGRIDFDSTYVHLTPFVGVEFPRSGTRWSITPHALIAWPRPTRGVAGHIIGSGFDLRGNTEDVGEGKHFGDPSLTIGCDVTYMPLNLTIDIGSLVTQRFLEPVIHKGIEADWLLSLRWSR